MTPVSEDGLVVNLWLAKSKTLYLPAEFLHVHGINTCLTERGAWTPQIYQGSCKASCIQVAEFVRCLSVNPKALFPWGESWEGQNHVKVVETGDEQEQVTLPLVTSLTPPTAKMVCLSCGKRAWARGPSLPSLLRQTEKRRTARGSFFRNCLSCCKAKSLRSPSQVTPTWELGHCLQRKFWGCWRWWSWLNASPSPLLPWTNFSSNFSLNLSLRSILPRVSPRKMPSSQFPDLQNALWTPKPWSSPEYSSPYRMLHISAHPALQSSASMSLSSSEGNASLVFLQWLQHYPGTRRDKLNQGIS